MLLSRIWESLEVLERTLKSFYSTGVLLTLICPKPDRDGLNWTLNNPKMTLLESMQRKRSGSMEWYPGLNEASLAAQEDDRPLLVILEAPG